MTDYTVDALEDMAIRQEPVPTQEQGRQEKQRILDSYRMNKFLEELNESTSAMWQRIEAASTAYRKAPGVETADALLEAIYNVKRKLPEKGACGDG